MNLLLDTHSFLWALFDPEQLSKTVSRGIQQPANLVSVSVLSFWEISLKYALGKLNLTGILPEELPSASQEAGFEIINIEPTEAAGFYLLPKIAHKDPFDRLLIWQAINRKMILVSRDRQFADYEKFGLKTLW